VTATTLSDLSHLLLPLGLEAFADSHAASLEWALTATLVAGGGQGVYGVKRDGRITFPRKHSFALTPELPPRPVAVTLFDAATRLHCLAIDLDIRPEHPRHEVARQSVDLSILLTACGFLCWIDESPSGGRHVYALLPTPVSFIDVRALVPRLKRLYPAIDPTPLLNPTDGRMRCTGSPHKNGGYQRLIEPLHIVQERLVGTSRADAWAHLRAALPPEQQLRGPEQASSIDDQAVLDFDKRGISQRIIALATHGDTTGRYKSASEARMAVAVATVAAGWTLAEYRHALKTRWTWAESSNTAKRRDFKQATESEFENAQDYLTRTTHRDIPDTSEENSRGGKPLGSTTDRRAVRSWITHTTNMGRRKARPYSLGMQAAVRTLGATALTQNRTHLGNGVRGYAIGSALGHTCTADALRQLEEDGAIRKVKEHEGLNAAIWELVLEPAASARPWRGKIHGCLPVFRALGGHQAAEIYEELVNSDKPLYAKDLIALTRRDPKTVRAALNDLASVDLAQRSPDRRWRVGKADPVALAKQLGATELEKQQIDTYREQRRRYRDWRNSMPERIQVYLRYKHQIALFNELMHATDDQEIWDIRLANPPPAADVDVG
jgi:hypothetical protein